MTLDTLTKVATIEGIIEQQKNENKDNVDDTTITYEQTKTLFRPKQMF